MTALAVAESWPRGLIIGLALYAAAVLSRMTLDLEGFAFLAFFPVIAIATLVGGAIVGGLFAVLCGLTAWGLVIPPTWSFSSATTNDGVAIAGFALVATVLVLLVDQLSSALRDAETARHQAAGALAGQRAMFLEFQHRVANSLQTSASVLDLERRRAEDAGIKDAAFALEESGRRLTAMARVHRRLYDLEAARHDFRSVIEDVCRELAQAFGAKDTRLLIEVNHASSLEGHRLLTLALIVTEAVTNSLKHAIATGQEGQIEVRFTRRGFNYELVVRDDGPGFPKQVMTQCGVDQNLGTLVMQALTRQIGGLVERANDNGAVMRLTFPAGASSGRGASMRKPIAEPIDESKPINS